jgi:hypothetical protein
MLPVLAIDLGAICVETTYSYERGLDVGRSSGLFQVITPAAYREESLLVRS